VISPRYRISPFSSMLLNRLSLRDLEYAVAVAEEKHFGRAAARCHVSQPALSTQIKKLEDTLGIQLFERTPHGVIVTESGSALIRQARRTLDEGRRFLELASAGDGLSGAIRVDVIATLGPYIAPHILRPLRERFPSVEFVLREGRTEQILAALTSGETDLALISTPIQSEGLELIPLFEERFVAIHPAEMRLPARAVTIADLESRHLIPLEEGHCLRDQTLALCRGAAGGARRHATSLETLRHMVAAGAGCSILPALAADDHETFGGLIRYAPIKDPRAFRIVALAFRSTDPRAERYQAIAETIRACLPQTVRVLDEPAGRAQHRKRSRKAA
jgi:LysR family transcriptional regulator, hydrogen peroxide-inducible genes activator